jgi:hypothetical protein
MFRSISIFCLSHISVLILYLIIYAGTRYFNAKYDKYMMAVFAISISLDQVSKPNIFIYLYTKAASRLIIRFDDRRKYGGKHP